MTRQEQLKWCKRCEHRKNDLNQGIICGLTNRIADFEDQCNTFDENPILKERLELKEAARTIDSRIASQGQRFANYIIDQFFIFGLGALIGAGLVLLGEFLNPGFFVFLDEENRLVDWLFGSILSIIYYAFFEGFTGRSLGKFFTKTEVVTEEGDRPGFLVIFTRSICRCIPFNALSFLANNGVGWHDTLSKTRVVEID